MSRQCSYHPSFESVSMCAICNAYICRACCQYVMSTPACPKCITKLRDRAAGRSSVDEPDTPSSAPPHVSPSPGATAPADPEPEPAAPRVTTATNDDFVSERSYADVLRSKGDSPRNLALGLLAGLLVGIAGSIVVMKILFTQQVGSSLLYAAVGYAIGYVVWKFTGQGGSDVAFRSVGLMFVSLFVAHIVFASDVLAAAKSSGQAPPDMSLLSALPLIMRDFPINHWVCVVLGFFLCWRAADRQPA